MATGSKVLKGKWGEREAVRKKLTAALKKKGYNLCYDKKAEALFAVVPADFVALPSRITFSKENKADLKVEALTAAQTHGWVTAVVIIVVIAAAVATGLSGAFIGEQVMCCLFVPALVLFIGGGSLAYTHHFGRKETEENAKIISMLG